MNPRDYLERMKVCSDENLRGEFGISDNWPISFGGDFDGMRGLIERSDKFRFHMEQLFGGLDFYYVLGTVIATLTPEIRNYFYAGKENDSKRKLQDYIQRNHKVSLILNPYQGDSHHEGIRMPCSDERAMACAIADIGEILLANNIPFCFPRSAGENHEGDFSRIVFHPELEIKLD